MILVVFGTRPEFIKIKPLIDEMNRCDIKYKTLFTGQHKDIDGLNADYIFTMNEECENRLNSVLINCLRIPDEYFEDVEYILVQGDTTSVLGLSLNAMNRKIKIIHLESGLRSYDNYNPYPEEFNRKLVSSISDIHLCPTFENKKNLLKENISKEKIYVVGNTGLDNLKPYENNVTYENIILVTLHRRENHDMIHKWFDSINSLSKKYDKYTFILPIHPNPNVQRHKGILTNVKVVNPLSHSELLKYLVKSKLVITDSGGLQEECSFLKKKCLVCRKTTERPESLHNTSFLVTNYQDLETMFEEHINDYVPIISTSPFGNGESSKKIIEVFKKVL